MLTCFDCEFSQIWTVNEDLKCKCKINGAEKNPYRPMIFPDSDCPNWQPSTESLLKEGIALLQEKYQIEERMKEAIKKVFAKLECEPICVVDYADKTIHIHKGLQNLAYKLQAETHTEPWGSNTKLFFKWNDYTFFELLEGKEHYNA